ncbi:alpha-glucan family phosphorylase [Sesbania bispinosa]|nr:alpha-glucan family phosphorylase [Sesbania bispinosa]
MHNTQIGGEQWSCLRSQVTGSGVFLASQWRLVALAICWWWMVSSPKSLAMDGGVSQVASGGWWRLASRRRLGGWGLGDVGRG